MNLRTVVHLVSILVTFLGFSMFVCVPVGILMNDSDRPVWLMALCGCVTTLLGIGGAFFSRGMHGKRLRSGVREGFATVSFGWLAALVFGALPFIIISDFHVADAVFETASGFTTTGASVIDSKLLLRNGTTLPNGVESLPYCLLFWRSLIVWLGGMGIVVFALVILPFLGVGGTNQLYNAEVPGLKTNSDQLTPRIASSAKILWLVFVALTVIETILLYVGGMNLFDSVCHSFCTIATGGFSTKNASIAYYSSPFLQWVIVIFMFLAACNFALSIKAVITKRWLIFFQDEEFKFFLILVLAAVGFSTLLLWSEHHEIVSLTGASEPNTISVALRYAAFQVVSIVTSTGFTTADYTLWPAGIVMILSGDKGFSLAEFAGRFAQNPISYIFALTAAVTWAGYSSMTRAWGGTNNPTTIIFLIDTAIFGVFWLLGIGSAPVAASAHGLMSVVFGGFAVGMAYVAWTLGMSRGSITILAAASYFTPVLSCLFATFWIDAQLDSGFWSGVALVVAGSLLCWDATGRGMKAKQRHEKTA